MYQYIAFLGVLLMTSYCHGYALGPPNSTVVCTYMIPNHNISAMTDPPSPFSFQLNATEYAPGDVVEVFLKASGQWFMEGLLVEARTVDCNGDTISVGRFSVQTSEDFLKPLDCFGQTASAITHFSHLHIYNRTFYWTAPSTSVGHVFLKATVVRNVETYWINVDSAYIYDSTNSTRSGLTKPVLCGADINRVTIATFLGIVFIFLLFNE